MNESIDAPFALWAGAYDAVREFLYAFEAMAALAALILVDWHQGRWVVQQRRCGVATGNIPTSGAGWSRYVELSNLGWGSKNVYILLGQCHRVVLDAQRLLTRPVRR